MTGRMSCLSPRQPGSLLPAPLLVIPAAVGVRMWITVPAMARNAQPASQASHFARLLDAARDAPERADLDPRSVPMLAFPA